MEPVKGDRFAFYYHKCRNISSPEDERAGRRVFSGSAPASSILELDDNENVREYLVDAKGKQKKTPTLVHQAIRKTLRESPEMFAILNSGTVLVARNAEVDDRNHVIYLEAPSIINGSQTQGELLRYFKERTEDDGEEPSIKYEVIVTDDDDLIAEVSIARNFQNDVKTISIAGRRGQLDELESKIQVRFPNAKLRKSESDLSSDNDYLDTEKIIQSAFALMPETMPLPDGLAFDLGNKVFAYSQKTRCLKTFQKLADDPESEMYRAFIAIAPIAWELYLHWKTHQGFIGTLIRSIVRENGKVVEVPDGIVFPILASHSVFVRKTAAGWILNKPTLLTDIELISAAKSAYMDIAEHNPQSMGKSKACYSTLLQITSIYAKLTRDVS
jgi:AIPR protein